MVSTEEALKRMEQRAKKKKKVKPTSISVTSPLLSLSGHGEKRREPKPSLRPVREPHMRRVEPQAAELVSVQFPPKHSICLDPEVFTPVFLQLVFMDDQANFERLGESSFSNAVLKWRSM